MMSLVKFSSVGCYKSCQPSFLAYATLFRDLGAIFSNFDNDMGHFICWSGFLAKPSEPGTIRSSVTIKKTGWSSY